MPTSSQTVPHQLFRFLTIDPLQATWGVWAVVWVTTGAFTKRDDQIKKSGARGTTLALLTIGALLIPSAELAVTLHLPDPAVFPKSAFGEATGLTLAVIGLSFAIWARLSLGRNWSGRVTIKHAHSLVATGAYAIVRHPIYAGICCALLGTGLVLNRWLAVVGIAVILIGIARKLRMEERLLADCFGARYQAYRNRAPCLFPRLPRS